MDGVDEFWGGRHGAAPATRHQQPDPTGGRRPVAAAQQHLRRRPGVAVSAPVSDQTRRQTLGFTGLVITWTLKIPSQCVSGWAACLRLRLAACGLSEGLRLIMSFRHWQKAKPKEKAKGAAKSRSQRGSQRGSQKPKPKANQRETDERRKERRKITHTLATAAPPLATKGVKSARRPGDQTPDTHHKTRPTQGLSWSRSRTGASFSFWKHLQLETWIDSMPILKKKEQRRRKPLGRLCSSRQAMVLSG